jgi:segregation and condensation protein A
MSRINQYLDIVKKASTGEHISIDSPFDRSVFLAFDLVLTQHLDPWNIDLVNFSSLYLKRAKEERIDLMTAGRIIYMAWKVLRMQSDNLVVNMEAKQEEEIETFGWEDIPTGTWLESDNEYSYTNLVMKMPSPPLEEPVRRDAKRKVSLIELLDAFDHARKEAEEYQLIDRLRREERERLAAKARKAMKGTAHEDHLEEDIMTVWDRIRSSSKKSMSFRNICESDDPEEHIKTFLSILFLAYDKKIRLYQRKFPYGEIYIKTLGYT